MELEKIEEEIRKYYENAELWLPPKSAFRHFRFFLTWKRVVKVKDRISSLKKLRRNLVRFAPLHAYYTPSLFLNPTVIGRKSEKIHQNLFLGSDILIFDVDTQDLEKAKREALRLLKVFKGELLYLLFSGGKGFHLAYKFDFKPKKENPIEREYEVLKAKKEIATQIGRDFLIDEVVTWDTRRIVRLPLTIHCGTGFLAEFVEPEKIMEFKPRRILPKKLVMKLKEKRKTLRDVMKWL